MKVLPFLALAAIVYLAGAPSAEAQGKRRSDLITQEEIAKATASNAYDLLRQLRPAWFRTRATAGMRDPSTGGLMFYVDGIRVQSIDDLEALPADRVKEARYLSAADATTKYGTDHPSGAVEITTKH